MIEPEVMRRAGTYDQSTLLRRDRSDYEQLPPYWKLRVFESAGNTGEFPLKTIQAHIMRRYTVVTKQLALIEKIHAQASPGRSVVVPPALAARYKELVAAKIPQWNPQRKLAGLDRDKAIDLLGVLTRANESLCAILSYVVHLVTVDKLEKLARACK